MIAADIFVDGFFAAVAAIGFGAISDPPLRAFPSIALLAAAGHALRFGLMTCAGLDITTATLCASLLIGLGSLWLGGRIYCPTTVLSIPALLPMVPDGLRPDHAHAAHRRERCGAAVYGCVPTQRDGHRQRRLHAGRRFDGADLTLPPPRLLAHAAPQTP